MEGITHYTIEPVHDGVAIFGHGEYPRSSVLAGQARRVVIEYFDTIVEAEEYSKSEGLQAEVMEWSTKNPFGPTVPDIAPSDFDPADAGEVWHEDDY